MAEKKITVRIVRVDVPLTDSENEQLRAVAKHHKRSKRLMASSLLSGKIKDAYKAIFH